MKSINKNKGERRRLKDPYLSCSFKLEKVKSKT
jgi:hypothetical protein